MYSTLIVYVVDCFLFTFCIVPLCSTIQLSWMLAYVRLPKSFFCLMPSRRCGIDNDDDNNADNDRIKLLFVICCHSTSFLLHDIELVFEAMRYTYIFTCMNHWLFFCRTFHIDRRAYLIPSNGRRVYFIAK